VPGATKLGKNANASAECCKPLLLDGLKIVVSLPIRFLPPGQSDGVDSLFVRLRLVSGRILLSLQQSPLSKNFSSQFRPSSLPSVPRRIWNLSPNTANHESRLTSSVSPRLFKSQPESLVLVCIVRGGRP
jgi:hypothetical protein